MHDHILDEYGFTAAALMGLEIFDRSQRRTGRTSQLAERAVDGDVVICATGVEARDLERLLRKADKHKVRVTFGDWNDVRERTAGYRGRIHYSHEFVRREITQAIKAAAYDLNHLKSLHAANVEREREHQINLQAKIDFQL